MAPSSVRRSHSPVLRNPLRLRFLCLASFRSRLSWYNYKMGDRDLRDALRAIDFREAYHDTVHLAVHQMEMAGLDFIPEPRQSYDGAHIESFFWYGPLRTPGYRGWGSTPDLVIKAIQKKANKPEFLKLVPEYRAFPTSSQP